MFLKQFSRIKFLGVIGLTVSTVSGVRDLPLEILISQSKPSLIYPGFEVVIKCYNYDLEYKLKNTEENWKAKHDEAEAPEIVFLKDPFFEHKKILKYPLIILNISLNKQLEFQHCKAKRLKGSNKLHQ